MISKGWDGEGDTTQTGWHHVGEYTASGKPTHAFTHHSHQVMRKETASGVDGRGRA
ncbi:MAG: hypothetical protein LZF60_230005 [Nitrospira sp.]|nr:MAG: hypothetical protein LZF60_230005 [Nitrospira sp.]